MNELNWYWIELGAVAPPVVALLLAFPFWRKREAIFGNLVGTVVMFGSAFALIMREHIELDRLMQQCADDGGILCFPNPAPFTRFAIYASIALVEVFAMFYLSIRVEEKIRSRDYSPEWR